MANIRGTGGSNKLTGTTSSDTIRGLSGNDTLLGGAGNDDLYGGGGNDKMEGGLGNDALIGGTGRDNMSGDAGNDRFLENTLSNGSDTMNGGLGEDRLDYRVSSNTTVSLKANIHTGTVTRANSLLGGDDTDRFSAIELLIATNADNDVVSAEEATSDVSINLTSGSVSGSAKGVTEISRFEHATGGSGNDTLTGSTANNSLDGGAGNDTFVIANGWGVDTIIDSAGTDTVNMSTVTANLIINLTTSTVTGPTGNEVYSTDTGISSTLNWDGDAVDNITAGSGNDTITGSTGNNSMNGGGGNDEFIMIVGHGDDTIVGGSGTDTIDYSGDTHRMSYSSLDNEVTVLGDDDATVSSSDVFSGVEILIGSTHVRSSIDASDEDEDITINLTNGTATGLTSGLTQVQGFNLVEGGSGNDTITGNTNSNILSGNEGNDSISGGSGNDTINGGEGDDELDGGLGSDRFVFNADWGQDTLEASSGFNDVVDFSAVTLNMTINMTGTGGNEASDTDGNTVNWDTASVDSVVTGDGDDSVVGNTGNNAIQTGAGNDTVGGGNGNDTLEGGAGDDSLSGGSGNDVFILSGAHGEDVIDGGGGLADIVDYSEYTSVITFNVGDGTVSGDDLNDTVSNVEVFLGVAELEGDVIDASDYEDGGLTIILGHFNFTSGIVELGYKVEGFESVVGTDDADIIVSNDAKNTITGGGGNDFIFEDYNADTYVFEDNWGDDEIYRSKLYDFPETETAGTEGAFEVVYSIIGGAYTDPDIDHDRLDLSAVTQNLAVNLRSSDQVFDTNNEVASSDEDPTQTDLITTRQYLTGGDVDESIEWIDFQDDPDDEDSVPVFMFEEILTGSGNDRIWGNKNANIFYSGAGNDVVGDSSPLAADFVNRDTDDDGDVDLLGDLSSQSYDVDIDGDGENESFGYFSFGTDLAGTGGGNDTYFDGAGNDIYLDLVSVTIDGDDTTEAGGGDDTYVFTNGLIEELGIETAPQNGGLDIIYDPDASAAQDEDSVIFRGFRSVDFVIRAESLDEDIFVDSLAFYCELGGEPWKILILRYFSNSFINEDINRHNPEEDGQRLTGNGRIANIVFDPNNTPLNEDDDIVLGYDGIVALIEF